jgi:hypothetical protein
MVHSLQNNRVKHKHNLNKPLMAIKTLCANSKTFIKCIVCICDKSKNTYILTHSRFIPEGVAEASQILFRDAHALP